MHLVKTKRRGALRVERLLQRPDRFLATVLLGNNLVNTAAAVLATVLTIKLIGEGDWAVVVSTLSVTIFLLVFGETFPKSVAWHRSEMVAFAVSRPLTLMGLALTPAVRMLQVVSYLGSRLAGGRDVAHQMGEQEIRTLISAGAQSGAVEPGEAAMLEKVFHFGDRQVREIMTPRPEIVWIESSTTLDGFLKSYPEHSHTRFPVFDGFIENVVGILSIKEVMLALSSGRGDGSSFVADFLRPAYFVPETKTVSSTFDEARQGGHSLVLTVDEFGGIAGLCTVKQLVEVVVGQVWEEGAEIEEVVTPVDEHTFRLDAGAGVN
jgi:putative hemolysin